MDSIHDISYQARSVSCPSIRFKFRYFCKYFYLLFRVMVQPHRPRLGESLPVFESTYLLNTGVRAQWKAFFGSLIKPCFPQSSSFSNNHQLQFSTHISASAFFILRYCRLLGINYSYLLYEGSELEFGTGLEVVEGQRYPIIFQYLGAERAGERSAVVRFQTLLLTEDSKVVLSQVDRFYVSEVEFSKAQAHAAPSINYRQLQREAKGAGIVADGLHIPRGWAARFGWLSGDFNVRHIIPRLAFLKRSSAYVQGLGTLNLAINVLYRCEATRLERISISFLRPMYEEQSLRVTQRDGQFFLYGQNKLIAAGKFLGE